MFRTTTTFDKLLDKATSNILLETDWPSIMQICDLIRQNDVQPKIAIMAIKKKLYSPNPHCAMYALQVLESIVKNCGQSVHDELTTKANCEMLRELAKNTQHENVRQKVLELIQAWTVAFRKSTKHRALKDTMNIMKTEGFKFPTLRESDAMFTADCAPVWTDGDVCHRCRVNFSFVQRKHHCRACGNVFCNQCSQRTTTLPKFGIEKEVRVCDSCFEQVNKPSTAAAPEKKESDSELPAEYLSSPLAQQNQAPPRKSEEELREEEELQLALALSKSEAEQKEKEKMRMTSGIYSSPEVRHSPVNHHTPRSISPQEEQAMEPELARYLNRSYWESRQKDENDRPMSPSAPSPMSSASLPTSKLMMANGMPDPEMDEFVQTLRSQVEIFVNRMKSNSSRGRSIANDSSVQTLFMNITAMHSRLLRYIQQQDDARLHYEGLQDKLTQVKDARAALDALRDEHREKLRHQAEEAERQRQLQMAHKLDIMRKKKQEYLQYQRQLALQRIQEQEREMQMRQEQQKQQYLMGSQPYGYIGSPAHGQAPAPVYYHPYAAPPPPQTSVGVQMQTPATSVAVQMPPPASIPTVGSIPVPVPTPSLSHSLTSVPQPISLPPAPVLSAPNIPGAVMPPGVYQIPPPQFEQPPPQQMPPQQMPPQQMPPQQMPPQQMPLQQVPQQLPPQQQPPQPATAELISFD